MKTVATLIFGIEAMADGNTWLSEKRKKGGARKMKKTTSSSVIKYFDQKQLRGGKGFI